MPSDFRPILACIEVSLKGQEIAFQSLMYNVIHVQTAAAVPSSSEISTTLGVVQTWCNAVYKLNYSAQLSIVEIRARSMASAVAPFGFVATNVIGTMGGYDEVEHAPLILLHGGETSRNQAGRFYAFSPGYGSVSPLGYDPTHMTNLTNALINLGNNLGAAGLQLAVGSEDTGVCYRVTSVGRTNRLTIQKRRRVGFGR